MLTNLLVPTARTNRSSSLTRYGTRSTRQSSQLCSTKKQGAGGMHWEVYGDFYKVAEPIMSFLSFN